MMFMMKDFGENVWTWETCVKTCFPTFHEFNPGRPKPFVGCIHKGLILHGNSQERGGKEVPSATHRWAVEKEKGRRAKQQQLTITQDNTTTTFIPIVANDWRIWTIDVGDWS